MKVVTAETMQEADCRAIDEYGIPGLDLMEKAGKGAAAVIDAEYAAPGERTVVIVAGKGNNGGDGFVIARHLLARGWKTVVFLLCPDTEVRGDAAENLRRLPREVLRFVAEGRELREELQQATVIVDAVFGTGLRSEVSGLYRDVIEEINASGSTVVAVDIPSGVAGSSGAILGTAVRAAITVTFALAKAGHVLYPGAGFCGHLRIVDIGIPPEVLQALPGFEYVDAAAAATLVRRRSPVAHKGSFGHLLIVAGSRGRTGAAAMAANSAVRSGSGLVTLAVPDRVHDVLEVKTTEAMTHPLPDAGTGNVLLDALGEVERLLPGKSAVAIGPGIGMHPDTVALVHELVRRAELPLVADADALNALSVEMGVLREKRTAVLVVTPHPGEMARLASTSVAQVEKDRIAAAAALAADFSIFVILKGARTVLAAPDGRIAVNGSGNPGMASGGMGDVLTGVVSSLLGQGYDPWDALRLGVFIHGHAADLVAAEKGEIGITAVDVQERLPHAFNILLRQEENR